MIRRLRIATPEQVEQAARIPPDPDAHWSEYAACRGTDPEIFYPAKGENSTQAKSVCAHCPVVESCLSDALARQEQWGIRGGLSPRERRKLAGRMRQDAA